MSSRSAGSQAVEHPCSPVGPLSPWRVRRLNWRLRSRAAQSRAAHPSCCRRDLVASSGCRARAGWWSSARMGRCMSRCSLLFRPHGCGHSLALSDSTCTCRSAFALSVWVTAQSGTRALTSASRLAQRGMARLRQPNVESEMYRSSPRKCPVNRSATTRIAPGLQAHLG